MQRNPGEWVPIGDALSGMGGPVKAIRAASPQAVHHFTQADQVNQLVAASEADPDLGFMARTMALCSLPRTNPGNRKEYKRVNGPFTLYMVAGGGNKLPFGNLPRLILAWVCSEAVRTQSRVLVLGKSLSEFMRTLDIYSSSGGKHTRLRNQMKRLFGCTVTMIYEDENVDATVNAVIADSTVFWWNKRKPDQPSLWDSKIELGEKFFNEIIHHPVPIEMNTLTAPQTLHVGPRSLPVAGVPHLLASCSTAAHLEAGVPSVRGAPGQGQRQPNRSTLPHQGAARVEEDQAGLAGSELLDGPRCLDPLALNTGDRAGGRAATAGPIALRKPQEWSATRRRCFGGGEDGQVRWGKSR